MSAPTLLCHGYLFNPRQPVGHKDHPETALYPLWRKMLAAPEAEGFTWFSKPSWGDFFRAALKTTRSNRYMVAFDWAIEAGYRLAREVETAAQRRGGPVNLLGHSLGTRVALTAVAAAPEGAVKRVLLLNGAAHPPQAYHAAKVRPGTDFLNIAVQGDDILEDLGKPFSPQGLACIGNVGIEGRQAANFKTVCLDHGPHQDWALDNGEGRLAGLGAGWGDHLHSYDNPDNWLLYRRFMALGFELPHWDELPPL